MKISISIIMVFLVAQGVFAEPGGSYTLKGNEKGIREIVEVDMAAYPDYYKGETLERYLPKFRAENHIGRRKLKPGDQLHFPNTMASLKIQKAGRQQEAGETRGLVASMGIPAGEIKKGTMAGYLLVPHDKAAEEYNAGFSMYVAAWPLLNPYPGSRFQTGLFGTWMFALNDHTPAGEKIYSDIEGGLGWWRDTRFATETPKFIMGGVALNFSEWANGPGAGKGRDWDAPRGKYGVAQLSPWLLWPPDGLNLEQGTCGELFGYGYLPLPLTVKKSTTAGANVPTGNHCWTLFLNARNFKGPMAFFTPYFFSKAAVDKPQLAGLFLDSRPSNPNRAIQMETQYVPAALAEAPGRGIYARIAPTVFPRGSDGKTVLVHNAACYSRKAIWNAVEAWFDGGASADGTIDPGSSCLYRFPGHGGATWKIYADSAPREDRPLLDWKAFANPTALDENTFGYRWDAEKVSMQDSSNGTLLRLPEYFQLIKNDRGDAIWAPIAPLQVPAETGLAATDFKPPEKKPAEAYVTPEDPASCWKTPGPVAGPFQAFPGDGSVVTYYWYRFADQPALLNADLTDAEREELQSRVEKIHRGWKKDRDYLPPPAMGELARIDPALIVTPPPGMEVGYVPIVTRQEENTRR